MSDEATELVISRLFAAPRELVYRAFTDPDQLAAWFGPVGYTVPRESVSIDVRVGGRRRMTMVGDADPSGTSVIDAVFTEVVENELLVGEETVEGIPGTSGPVTMTLRLEFADENGKTRLTLRQGPFASLADSGARLGWESSFTKLDALLAA